MSFTKIAALAVCACATSLPSWAEKPEWAGKQETPHRRDHSQSQPDKRAQPKRMQFGDRHRESVRDYFEPRVRAGRCPPGLAKKNNGCLPPGQARQWTMGQPLPLDLVRYPLPVELRHQLGRPPAGYEYVRVGNDILMLIIGTGMVVDAIENLGGF